MPLLFFVFFWKWFWQFFLFLPNFCGKTARILEKKSFFFLSFWLTLPTLLVVRPLKKMFFMCVFPYKYHFWIIFTDKFIPMINNTIYSKKFAQAQAFFGTCVHFCSYFPLFLYEHNMRTVCTLHAHNIFLFFSSNQ